MQKKIIVLSYWVSAFSEGASQIMIPMYLAQLGFDPTSIGITFFFYELFGLVTNAFSGYLIHRMGFLMAALLAMACHTIASFGYLLIDLEVGGLLVIIGINILRSCRGVAKELMRTATSVALRKKKGEKTTFLPLQIVMGGKEWNRAAGILVGGSFVSLYTYDEAFAALGFLSLFLFALGLWKLGKPTHHSSVPLVVSFREFTAVKKKLKRLAWVQACLYCGRDLLLAIALPLFLQTQGILPGKLGVIMAGGWFCFGFGQILGGAILKSELKAFRRVLKPRYRYRDSLSWALWVTACWFFLMALHLESTAFVIALVMAANLSAGIATAPINHLHIKYSRGGRSAVDIAYFKTVANLGKVAAGLLSGMLYQFGGIFAVMNGSGLLIAAGAGLGRLLRKK